MNSERGCTRCTRISLTFTNEFIPPNLAYVCAAVAEYDGFCIPRGIGRAGRVERQARFAGRNLPPGGLLSHQLVAHPLVLITVNDLLLQDCEFITP